MFQVSESVVLAAPGVRLAGNELERVGEQRHRLSALELTGGMCVSRVREDGQPWKRLQKDNTELKTTCAQRPRGYAPFMGDDGRVEEVAATFLQS